MHPCPVWYLHKSQVIISLLSFLLYINISLTIRASLTILYIAFYILDFCQNSQKHLSNSFTYWFCIFGNLANSRGGLAFMQVRSWLGKHRSATTPARDRDSHAWLENTDHGSSKMDQRPWLSGHRPTAIIDYLLIYRKTCTVCRSLGSSYRATGRSNWWRTCSTRVAVDFLNARRKPTNGTRPRALKTFGSWVHILVNGKSNLQNSWRRLVFLVSICFSELTNSNKWQKNSKLLKML